MRTEFMQETINMDSYSSRKKEYPNISYQKSPRMGRKGDRISIGNLNENLVGGEKKRCARNYSDRYGDGWISDEHDGHDGARYQLRRRQQV